MFLFSINVFVLDKVAIRFLRYFKTYTHAEIKVYLIAACGRYVHVGVMYNVPDVFTLPSLMELITFIA